MTSIKLFNEQNEDLRRIPIDHSLQKLTLEYLHNLVAAAFPEFAYARESYTLVYQDDEGDRITISKDSDVDEALLVAAQMKTALKVIVASAQAQEQDLKPSARIKQMLNGASSKLEEKSCHPMYLPLKRQVQSLLMSATGLNAVVTIFLIPEYIQTLRDAIICLTEEGDIEKSVDIVVTSSCYEQMEKDLLGKYAGAKGLLDELRALASKHIDSSQTTRKVSAELEHALELVTGSRETPLEDLTADQSAEILINLEVPMDEIMKMALEERVARIEKFYYMEGKAEVKGDDVSSEDLEPKSDAIIQKASFVGDFSTPDGTMFSPKEQFTKGWRLKNDGDQQWQDGTKFVHVGGELYVPDIDIPLTKVGDNVDILLSLVAPETPGRHVGYFRLASKDGERFGDRVWVDIMVDEVTQASIPSGSISMTEIAEELPSIPPQPSTPSTPATAAQAQAETIASPISLDKPSPFEAQLVELSGMGFTNRADNIRLLTAAKGNLQVVINQLLG